MSLADNKQVVAPFVAVCHNQHDLAAPDAIFHPNFVNHYAPAGGPLAPTPRPAEGFQACYGLLLQAFPDATMGDQRAARRTGRGGHPQDPARHPPGALWGLPPPGNRGEGECSAIFRVRDGQLVEHWTHMDLEALCRQMRPRE